jgi:hypothetical protein
MTTQHFQAEKYDTLQREVQNLQDTALEQARCDIRRHQSRLQQAEM